MESIVPSGTDKQDHARLHAALRSMIDLPAHERGFYVAAIANHLRECDACLARMRGKSDASDGAAHNHGPHSGLGLECPETRLADGSFRGECKSASPNRHEHDMAGCLDCLCNATPMSSRTPCTCPEPQSPVE